MTIIALAQPNTRCNHFRVFGVYADDEHERFVFGIKEFDEQDEAERYARWMLEQHGADHLERRVE